MGDRLEAEPEYAVLGGEQRSGSSRGLNSLADPARLSYAGGSTNRILGQESKSSRGMRLDMLRLLLHWIVNAVALLLVAHFVPGFVVKDFVSALIAVVVIGLLNATLGLLLKLITLPLGVLTLGLFFLVINAVILWFASKFVPGFSVTTFTAAFLGALALFVVHLIFGLFKGAAQS
jgi:putative membrane protein